VAETTAAAAAAQTAALAAQEALKPAREEDAVASALLHNGTTLGILLRALAGVGKGR
jgi:chromosome segregation protein